MIPALGWRSLKERQIMQPNNWAPEHSQALSEYLARGMSYSEIADAINARFGTSYTRSAAIGRGKRIGVVGPARQDDGQKRPPKAKAPRWRKLHERRATELNRPAPAPAPERSEPVKLRCVGVTPRLLSVIELEPDDCRYPYGGDKEGDAIAFCGHPQLEGSSYCVPHFHLTRGFGTRSERAVGPVVLRLVEAA